MGPQQVICAPIIGLPRACKHVSQCAQAVLSRHQEDSNAMYRLLVFVEDLTRNLRESSKRKIDRSKVLAGRERHVLDSSRLAMRGNPIGTRRQTAQSVMALRVGCHFGLAWVDRHLNFRHRCSGARVTDDTADRSSGRLRLRSILRNRRSHRGRDYHQHLAHRSASFHQGLFFAGRTGTSMSVGAPPGTSISNIWSALQCDSDSDGCATMRYRPGRRPSNRNRDSPSGKAI